MVQPSRGDSEGPGRGDPKKDRDSEAKEGESFQKPPEPPRPARPLADPRLAEREDEARRGGRGICSFTSDQEHAERTGGLGDDLSLSGGGEGAGGTCWAPGRGVLGLQLAVERGAGEEPTEGRERREAERGCRFPSGGGLFPTRAGPAAFLCQGVLPAP
ncbi:unnamed protein product [Rangifer tarandus platyrhynchus]|uniref:Uncharacterized protein n=1 Tax=Rangifer tarandus platyrhynchus TaxID=3082113 RepID=A0ABN8ZVR5_RANTA|nr:unnamed protein product [Rangifer tarandus platyrhynchus]